MAGQAQWHLSGDYFENCNCSVVCPCLVSKNTPLTSRPTEGVCDVAFISGNIFTDHEMRWDNSGKNGHSVVESFLTIAGCESHVCISN